MSQTREHNDLALLEACRTGNLNAVIEACDTLKANINSSYEEPNVRGSYKHNVSIPDGNCKDLHSCNNLALITPVIAAFLKGHYEIVNQLIKRGAKLEVRMNARFPSDLSDLSAPVHIYLYHLILVTEIRYPISILGMILAKIEKPSEIFYRVINNERTKFRIDHRVVQGMMYENLLCGNMEAFHDEYKNREEISVDYLTTFLRLRSFTCTSALKALTAFEKIYRQGLIKFPDYAAIIELIHEKTKVDILQEELPIEFCISIVYHQTVSKLEDICYELSTWLLPGNDRAVAGIMTADLSKSRRDPVKMRDLLNMDETELVKRLYAVTLNINCNMLNNPAALLLGSLVASYDSEKIEEEDERKTPFFTGALKIKVISVMKTYFGLTHDQKVQLSSLITSEKVAASLEVVNRPVKQSVDGAVKGEQPESPGKQFKVFG